MKGASHLEGFPAGGPPPSWDKWIHSLAAGQVGEDAIAWGCELNEDGHWASILVLIWIEAVDKLADEAW